LTPPSPAFDPEAIEEIEHVWIPARDGKRLAARIWMPREAAENPVPAILEYIPYRKRDFMRERDEPMHRYFAHAGYASIRVDLRGSGDSEGLLTDEYHPLEQDDAVDIISWISAQTWCDGAVGMTGISWGGFNALQVAARRPPALKAIISLCASDDRYSDDAHYKGGCLLNENMQWGSILTLYNALPPDPDIVGDCWRAMWEERLEALRPFPPLWMRHQSRDDYWRQGSICEDYGAIECAVYAIGGWADGYTNAIPRLMEGLNCPRKALIGPWAHMYPHLGVPGPAIGYLQEAVRWWDHWLKGKVTGIMDEPMFRAWLQDHVSPASQHATRPGRWVAERSWPNAGIDTRTFFPWKGSLPASPKNLRIEKLSSPETLGLRGGEWCGFGADGEAARDQRPDDGGSLNFDSDPFETDTDILGIPRLDIRLKSDRPHAVLVARLCDVAPDGSSLRISYGMLNLVFREGFSTAVPINPEEWFDVSLTLDMLGHRLARGHRLRLSLSTGYWPMVWPSPEQVSLQLAMGDATLSVPVRKGSACDEALNKFPPPLAAPGTTYLQLKPKASRRKIEVDLTTNETTYIYEGDGGEFGGAEVARLDEIDLNLGYWIRKVYSIKEGDPLSARVSFHQRLSLERGDWKVSFDLETRLAADAESFHFHAVLKVEDACAEEVTREWTARLNRDSV